MKLLPNPVYLDYNATAPVKPAVIITMAEVMSVVGNPSSVHASGRTARQLVSSARREVARLVGAAPEGVIFTSGGTEANNQALGGYRGAVMVSPIEHPSVLALAGEQPAPAVDGNGIIDLGALERSLESHRPATLAVMLANNETGVIQPIAEVATIAARFGVRLHVDAVQAAGKIPVDLSDLRADTLSLSAHKMGGPQGVGALIIRPGIEPLSLIKGGAQERRFRAGTENVAGVVGFGKAAELAKDDDDFTECVGTLRDSLEAGVMELAPHARIVGAGAQRLPTTSCIILPGVAQEVQLMHFDLAGIAVSAGSACSSGKVGPSPVLAAMGIPPEDAACAIRISLGWDSRASDVEHFLETCHSLLAKQRQKRHG